MACATFISLFLVAAVMLKCAAPSSGTLSASRYTLEQYNTVGTSRESFVPEFSEPSQITAGEEDVTLGLVMQNFNTSAPFPPKLTAEFTLMFKSLAQHVSSRRDVVFIVMTDDSSRGYLYNMFMELASKCLTLNIIREPPNNKFPRLSLYLVNMEEITNLYSENVKDIKANFGRTDGNFSIFKEEEGIQVVFSFKDTMYREPIFHIAPFYPRIFLNLDKLVLLDVDLEFKSDINQLFDEFAKMEEESIVGIGRDLSPHYRVMITNYRKEDKSSRLGDPGPLQGYNTGVVLLRLNRARKSAEWNAFLQREEMDRLAAHYRFQGHLGAQDWLTLFCWNNPQLCHVLDCRFNYQTSGDYHTDEYLEVFPLYRRCEGPIKIVHNN